LRGEELDARADVYGVGIVLYEMLAGQRAFAGDSLDAIRCAVLAGAATPVRELNPKVDQALSDLVARAMARRAGDRFRSARQLSRALRTWISEETNGLAHRDERRAGSGWTYAAGATLTLALGASAWLLLLSRDDAAPAPAVMAMAAAPARVAAPAPAPVVAAVAPVEAPAAAIIAALPATAEVPAAAAAPPVVLAAGKPRDQMPRVVRKDKAAPIKTAPATSEPAAAAASPGIVQLAVVPWGQIEVNGRAMGITPPLSRLSLPAGKHQIVVRNGDFPAYTASVTVSDEKPVTLRHRFE